MTFSVSDEVLIGTTLFLGAVAIFGPALADKFKEWLVRPDLHLEVRLSPPDCHMAEMYFRLSPSQVFKDPGFVYRMRVTNRGRSQARKCEVVVEGIAIADAAGRYIPLTLFTPVRLVWGSGNADFVDINLDRPFFCDLFKIPHRTHQKYARDLGHYVDVPGQASPEIGLVLDVQHVFTSQPNRLGAGKYQLEIAIYSENASKSSHRVRVAWSGAWKDSQEEMFRECVVTT